MKFQRTAIRIPVMALSVIVVILAAGLAYDYATASNEISNLKQTGREACSTLAQNAAKVAEFGVFLSNATATIQGQIQSDRSMIVTLNSTRPAGYSSMMATLNHQITYDLYAINQTQSQFQSLGGNPVGPASTGSYCAIFS